MHTAIAPNPTAHQADNPPTHQPRSVLELIELIDALMNAARREGRALARSTADDVPPIGEACAATDAARRAVLEALPAFGCKAVL